MIYVPHFSQFNIVAHLVLQCLKLCGMQASQAGDAQHPKRLKYELCSTEHLETQDLQR